MARSSRREPGHPAMCPEGGLSGHGRRQCYVVSISRGIHRQPCQNWGSFILDAVRPSTIFARGGLREADPVHVGRRRRRRRRFRLSAAGYRMIDCSCAGLWFRGLRIAEMCWLLGLSVDRLRSQQERPVASRPPRIPGRHLAAASRVQHCPVAPLPRCPAAQLPRCPVTRLDRQSVPRTTNFAGLEFAT